MQMVAGSMRDAFGVNTDSKLAGIIESEGLPAADHVKHLRDIPPEQATDRTAPPKFDTSSAFGLPDTGAPENFGLAAASLRQALQSLPDFAELSKNVVMARTEQGLAVSSVDQDGRSMFPEGSSRRNAHTRRLLETLGPALRQMPNRIAVTGCTATDRPAQRPAAPPWELSAGRAVSVRDILAGSGVPDDRFAPVAGKADTEPMFPDTPSRPANRRVTVTLLKEAPPVPNVRGLP
ncbi:chemotaxis protein MotB [Methylobacterium sp. PvR107]|nr:chemotaxis protein MotB [Methylobacterium sp. PvR107]